MRILFAIAVATIAYVALLYSPPERSRPVRAADPQALQLRIGQ